MSKNKSSVGKEIRQVKRERRERYKRTLKGNKAWMKKSRRKGN